MAVFLTVSQVELLFFALSAISFSIFLLSQRVQSYHCQSDARYLYLFSHLFTSSCFFLSEEAHVCCHHGHADCSVRDHVGFKYFPKFAGSLGLKS